MRRNWLFFVPAIVDKEANPRVVLYVQIRMCEGNHLVILSPGFPCDESDSVCLPAQQQFVRQLQSQFPDHQITVIAFEYPYSGKPYHWNGIAVYPLNGRNRKKGYRLLTWMRAWRLLKRLHRQRAITALLSFWLDECALIGMRFAKKRSIRHFTWILGQDARSGNRYARWLRPNPSSLIALSDFLAEEYERNYGNRPAHIIPNAIDPAVFDRRDEIRKIDLLAAGSLIPLKQYEILVEVVKRLKRKIPQVNAVICGTGPEVDRLKKKIDADGLTNVIRLAGEKTHTEVFALMQQSRIFLHPSSYEGFSGACLEALFAGAKVVSFTFPSAHSITGWHTVQTVEEMTDQVENILTDTGASYGSLLVHEVKDTARLMMNLLCS